MRKRKFPILSCLFPLVFSATLYAQQLSREEWGAMPVTVSHRGDNWQIDGKLNSITLNQSNLGFTVRAGKTSWTMMRSVVGDMLVKSKGEDLSLRLADAKKITIVPYDSGFKSGVKISLTGWEHKGVPLGLDLFLT